MTDKGREQKAMNHIPNMCHHGVDGALTKCGECAIEKAAERDLERRGIEPVAVPESGNCLLRIFGENNYTILDARIWTVLRDLSIDLQRASSLRSQEKGEKNG